MMVGQTRAIGRRGISGFAPLVAASFAPARRAVLGGLVAFGALGALTGAATAEAPAVEASAVDPAVQADLETLRGYRFGQLRAMRVHEAPAPVFDAGFFGPDGEPTSLADLDGKVRFVNFWATWCAPCLHEMPSIDRLVGALEAEGMADRVAVVTISVDRGDPSRPRGWLEREGLQRLVFYHDPANDTSIAARLRGMPTSLIVDAEGRELARFEGPAEWDGAEVVALLRDLAKEPPGDGTAGGG